MATGQNGKQHKAFRFEVLSIKANEEGTEAEFEGYASVFNNKDLGGDIVMPGAFTKTLSDNGGKFPLLADHDYTLKGRLGVSYCTQDEKGLKVKGHINLESGAGKEVYSHLKQAESHGVDLGMSFGYSIPQGKSTYDKTRQARLIHEVKLYEVTVTQFPMNTEASVTDVKASFTEYFERYRERGQLSSEYWAIDDARYSALYDTLYLSEDDAAERLQSISETADAWKEALLDWAGRYFEFYEVKAEDPFQKQHQFIHEQIKALLHSTQPVTEPASEAAVIETEPQDDKSSIALLRYLHDSLNELNQAEA